MGPAKPCQSRSAVGSGKTSFCFGVSKGMEPMALRGLDATLRRSTESWSVIKLIRAEVKSSEL